MMIWSKIIDFFKLKRLCRYWKKNNQHNFTYLGQKIYLEDYDKAIHNGLITVGNCTYGEINCSYYGNINEKLIIGNYCSIAGDVLFLLGGNHNYKTASTYPFKVKLFKQDSEAYTNGPIVVEDDVWIGQRSVIMSGITIGQGAIIAAGSVVTKNVAPYSVVGGVPAKLIKYRFDQKLIEELEKIDFSKLTKSMIEDHIDELYRPINMIDDVKWMPKKIKGDNIII